MEKPLCKLCKERHYGLCAAFKASLGSADAKPASAQQRAKAVRAQVPGKERANVARSQPTVPTAGAADTGFNRTAYQREYVAKWRRGEVGNKHRAKKKEARK